MIATTIDGRRLQFNFDGTVLAPDDNVAGTWTTEAPAGALPNRLNFTLPDQSRSQIDIDYDFNADCQLTIAIPVQPGVTTATPPVAVPGQIFADDPEDVQYAPLDATGAAAKKYRIFVYGTLRVEQRTDQLVLRLRDTNQDIVIQGDRPNANCLTSSDFQQAGQPTIDRLRFSAKTRNKVDGKVKLYPADIQFVGSWNFVDNKLVFAARYSNTGGQSNAVVALVGTYKATNYGLVFSSSAAGKSFSFVVNSRIEVSGITGEWALQLGYSSQSRLVSGSFTANANVAVGKDGKLDLKGSLNFNNAGGKLALEVELNATYTFERGELTFRVKGGASGYTLYFGGRFKIGKNGTVEFEINYGPSGVSGRLKIEVGDLGDSKIKAGLELIVSRTGSSVSIDVGVAFSVTWVNGTMIATPAGN